MRWMVFLAFAPWLAGAAIGASPTAVSELTAEQVVEKNVAARGGAEAWAKIQTMVWVGHMKRGLIPSARAAFEQLLERDFRISAVTIREALVRVGEL